MQIRKLESLEFAGEQVPLHRWDVRERLERELSLSVQNRGQVLRWLKRAARCSCIEAALGRARGLSGIAQRYQVSVVEVRRRDPAIRGRHIRPGDALEIRCSLPIEPPADSSVALDPRRRRW